MAELRDLECGPVIRRQCCDQASDHAGLAHIARLAADYDDRHCEERGSNAGPKACFTQVLLGTLFFAQPRQRRQAF